MARARLRPNILYLHSHDTGRFIQPYGFAVSTPHLQRFAEEGVLLRQAFAVSPTCSPSRAALLTGEYPHQCGMNGLASPPWNYRLADPRHLLPRLLSETGYLTVLGGVHHVGEKSLTEVDAHGFQLLLNADNLCEDVPDLHQRAASFVRQPTAAPWFLALGFDQTHRDNRQGDPKSGAGFSQPEPYDVRKIDGRYTRPPPGVVDRPETRADMASFKEGVRRLDARIGTVLSALERSGQADNTLVIITTDHGAAWPGMKCNLTDQGLGVMLMLRGPGGFKGGRVIDPMATHLDLCPTIAAVADLSRQSWWQGRSLLPLLRRPKATLHREIFAEQNWHELPDPQRAVRTARYKLVRRLVGRGPAARNCDEGPTKRVLRAAGFFDHPRARESLYDLILDPLELCDRISDPTLTAQRRRLGRALDRWMRATADPFPKGKGVPPPGAAK